jgi:hypothetical protein
MGEDETNSIITYAGVEGHGEHWLIGREVTFHPANPEYLVVTPDGAVERRAIPGR